jgi:hypothetical protein
MTKTEQLTEVLDQHGALDSGWSVEFRPFRGWYLVGESRYIGDEGDWLGTNYHQARPALIDLVAWLAKVGQFDGR